TKNLIDDPTLAPVVAQMQREMLRWLMETADVVPYEKDQRWSKEMMMAKARRSMNAGQLANFERDIDRGVPFFQALFKNGGAMR
ncbi:MAG: hypothetical protein J5998_08625, partial [Clostridia bacterium]|nr:hypothetical protein [Clostridia bacterium]